MLIFTYKLEKYVKNKLLPKLLLLPNKYIIKGSFRRRIPYITDIDIINEVYPTINSTNIYDELIKLIMALKSNNNSGIILVHITCGTDERFSIKDASESEINTIKLLLNNQDFKQLNIILEKYADNNKKKIFFINEMVWEYYRLRWTPEEVLANKKKLAGGVVVKFTDIIKENSSLLLQYFVKIESYPVGIDIVVNYEPIDLSEAYKSAGNYQLKLANYSKEYYYMLFPFRYYFKNNKSLVNELENLIEKKLGLYKQLMVRIDSYHVLYNTNNLDIRTATSIVSSIIRDTNNLSGFSSDTIEKIRQVSINNPLDVKMSTWSILLDVLYDEINAHVNNIAKDYFFKYLEMIPEDIRNQYHLPNQRLRNGNKLYRKK